MAVFGIPLRKLEAQIPAHGEPVNPPPGQRYRPPRTRLMRIFRQVRSHRDSRLRSELRTNGSIGYSFA